MKRRNLSRQKKTAIWVAGIGVVTGVTAMLLWPRIKSMLQQPVITVGTPTITPVVSERYDLDFLDS